MNPREVVLSIIIVNFETPDYTLECIRSIFKNRPACPFEVLVIDNGSHDDSLEILRREAPPEAVCIEAGDNLGFSRANNLGIHNARGNFILLLNSDTKILDSSIDRLLDHLIANPQVGAVGPKQLDGKGRLQLSWGNFPTFFSEIYRKLLHYRLSLNDWAIRDYLEEKYADSTDVDWISGSCLLARKEALVNAGLLDEHFFMYFEDVDLCRSIRDAGWRIHYYPEAGIIHYGGVSARKNLLRVLVEYRQSQIYFARKYYGRGGVAVLKALLFVKYTLYFFTSTVEYVRQMLARRDTSNAFAKLLLSKKAMQLVFGQHPAKAIRP